MRDALQYRAGDTQHIDGIDLRIRPGWKSPTDLIIEWDKPKPGWRAVPCKTLFYIVEFIAWNEDGLYSGERQLGGEKLMRALRMSRSHGWERAAHVLDDERARAAARREQQQLEAS